MKNVKIKIMRLNFFLVIIFIISSFSCKKDDTVIPTVRVTSITSINVQVNKMCFINSTLGFAACNESELYKTTDGGSSWNKVNTFPEVIDPYLLIAELTDVRFTSANNGFVLGGGKVYKTTDGGSTWTQINLGGNLEFTCMDFPTTSCGYIAANTAIYQTTNGGANWYQITKPSYDCEPFKIAFSTPDTGLVNDYFNHYTYFTTDGGNTWTSKYNDDITHVKAIKFISKTEGYAVNVGIIYKSTDKGITWHSVNSTSSATEFMLSGIDATSELAIAVGDMSVFVSENGSSWEYRLTEKGINLEDWLTDVHIISSTSAIASSESGTFYRIETGREE